MTGSKDVLAQKARGVENILQVKAGKAIFDETNLTVITADGKLYSYVVNIAGIPAVPNVASTAANDNKHPEACFSGATYNEAVIGPMRSKLPERKEPYIRCSSFIRTTALIWRRRWQNIR